jgi:hypothetical protein
MTAPTKRPAAIVKMRFDIAFPPHWFQPEPVSLDSSFPALKAWISVQQQA